MKPLFKYTLDLLKHKWYVFKYGLKLKVPFYLLILHDISKFHPSEFFAYARQFYDNDGNKMEVRNKNGSYRPELQPIEFKLAWLHHQNNNKHHWQYWVIPHRWGYNSLYMPEKYIREMIADWISAGICISGRIDPTDWYEKTKHNMPLTNETIDILEKIVYNEVDKIL